MFGVVVLLRFDCVHILIWVFVGFRCSGFGLLDCGTVGLLECCVIFHFVFLDIRVFGLSVFGLFL